MKKLYFFKSLFLLTLCFTGLVNLRAAITNPSPFDLSTGNYSMTNWPAASAQGTYPANMKFHWFTATQSTATVSDAAFDFNCPYNLSSASRILGLDANGFAFLATSGAQGNACASGQGGFVGDDVLGLTTTGRSNIQVQWTSSTIVAADGGGNLALARIFKVRLQYRVGAAGNYTDVPGPIEYTSVATINQNVVVTGTLPAACENQPLVYVRWLYFESPFAGATGTRPELNVDEVSVTSQPGYFTISSPTGLTTLNTNQPVASPPGTFQLSGTALSAANTTVSFSPATSNFELSTNNVSYSSSLTLPNSNGGLTGQPVLIYVRQSAVAPLGTNSATVQIAATGATTSTVSVSGTVSPPVPVITPSVSSLSGFSAIVGNPSSPQNFNVSAANLTANVTATAPSGYEISLNNIVYSSSLNLTQSGGTLIGQPVYIYVRISAAAPLGPANGTLTLTSTGATTQNISLTGTVTVPPPVITASALNPGGPFTAIIGNASPAQTFTVSGANLQGDVTITPPANYELSLNNVSYTPTLLITQSGGVLPGQPITVYVRIAASAPGGAQNGNIALTSLNATTVNIAVTGNVVVPTISATGTINLFNTMSGTPSAPQTLTLNGSSLQGDVNVTAPAGFEISTDNITYNNSMLLLQVGGNLVGQPLTFYIRMKASAAGWYSGNVQFTSPSATTVNILVRGNANLPFTNGNIAVSRVGDGVATLTNTGSQTFIDEFTPAGVLVQSIPLPGNDASHNLINSGTATSEAFVTRSLNGQYLAMSGYNRALGGAGTITSTTSAAVNRVVGLVKYDGTVDVSTSLNDAGSGNNTRTAFTTNGTDVWIGDAGDGIRYATLGSSTSTQISTTQTNIRNFNLAEYGGVAQLFISAGTGSIRVGTIGTGVPTTSGQTLTNIPGVVAGLSSPYQYFFADLDPTVPGADVLYVADDGVGIVRFSLVAGTWTQDGVVGTPADKYRGIAGSVNYSTGVMTMYAVGGFDGTAGGNGGVIVSFTDNMGYHPVTFLAPVVTTIVNAGTGNKISYRSVALAPTHPVCTGGTLTWTGNASSNTKLAENWCGSVAPTTADDAIIPAVGPINQPRVDSPGNNAHNLTINSGAAMVFGSGSSYNLTGNIVNNGTFNSNLGSLSFTGGSAQSTPALHVANLTMNGSSLNPAGNVQVDTFLTMTAGDIQMPGDTITLGQSVSQRGTLSHSSGRIYGYMKRWFNGTNALDSTGLFPFGFSNNNRFITVSYTTAPTTPGSLTGHYYANGNRPFTLNNAPIMITNGAPCNNTFHVLYIDTNMWKIVPADGFSNVGDTAQDGFYNVNIAAENLNGMTNVCELTALKSDNDTNFFENGIHITSTIAGSTTIAERDHASGWSDWTYGGSYNNPLLIKLLSFDGRKQGAMQSRLEWQANADGGETFVLERSSNGEQFTVINTQLAKSGANNYNYIDNSPAAGKNYYRLAIKDQSGKTVYSNVIVIAMDGAKLELVSIAPNVITGGATVQVMNGQDETATMRIVDAVGTVVMTEAIHINNGNTFFTLNASGLATGTYMLQLTNTGGERVQQRFIKQ